MRNSGFTLIELLIVLAISAMLAGITIGYSGIERNQTNLFVESTEISQFILQARSLAIATYGSSSGAAPTCGYGMAFDPPNHYSIFAYVPGTECTALASTTYAQVSDINNEQRYTDETWDVETQNGVTFSQSAYVFFYPPNPSTLLFSDSSPVSQVSIKLVTSDGQSSSTIYVNSAGQVNF